MLSFFLSFVRFFVWISKKNTKYVKNSSIEQFLKLVNIPFKILMGAFLLLLLCNDWAVAHLLRSKCAFWSGWVSYFAHWWAVKVIYKRHIAIFFTSDNLLFIVLGRIYRIWSLDLKNMSNETSNMHIWVVEKWHFVHKLVAHR